jgi:hypothetical protein
MYFTWQHSEIDDDEAAKPPSEAKRAGTTNRLLALPVSFFLAISSAISRLTASLQHC